MLNEKDKEFIQMAIELAQQNVENNNGGPFGCIIVKNNQIIGKGANSVTSENDPTAHAEVVAIRNACKNLKSFQLEGCSLYTSCEPCPMCLGAIYWARPTKVVFAATKIDAASAGFDDDFIYKEINLSYNERKIPFIQYESDNQILPFEKWKDKTDKTDY
ncbi:nucleoside deaminase [Rhizosphaericola mali]|uniref:Nucleoside deaminase n=1 Tax=Rhizosphaericola mali TaxID=2545455 RepID=A0A5P2G0C0_9BACT|nr:nucleoside deaminase [Rhizosphaericola mali]QES87250.1 nucleoside deaminase [Rhizosphaericola mali]